MENETDKDVGNNRFIKHRDIFAQYQTQLANNDIVMGVRNINHVQFSDHNTYNLGWGKDINADLRLNAAFGTATNLPYHYANNLNVVAGKTELKPEHSKSIEVGATYKNLGAKLYKNKMTDAFTYTDPQTCSTGEYTAATSDPFVPASCDDGSAVDSAFYTNGNGIQNQGIELTLSHSFADWEINHSLTLQQSIDSITKLDQGRRPNKTLDVIATNTRGKFYNTVQLIAKSKTFDNDDTTTNGTNPGYGLLNLATRYDYSSTISLSFNLNNALDKQYTVAKTAEGESYNQLGRTFTAGVIYQF